MNCDFFYEKKDKLQYLIFYLFIFLILTISPNYIMVFYPWFKYVWCIVLCFFFIFFFKKFNFFKINIDSSLFVAFYCVVLILSVVNFIRMDSLEALYFSFGIFFKFSLIYLFVMSLNYDLLTVVVKNIIYTFFVFCFLSLLGWFLYFFNLINVTDVVEEATYYYNVMSFFGVFTVSFPLGSFEIIRNQFYFQEPGMFAFYILVIMTFLCLIKNLFKNYSFNVIYIILFVTMLTTLSVTGIALSILLSIFHFKSFILNIFFSILCFFILGYIIFSDNPYVNKNGSFDERLYGLTGGVDIFDKDPITFLIGAGYNSEIYFGFDGKFNNFILEVILYSGFMGLFFLIISFIPFLKLDNFSKICFLLILFFCLTTPLFWSPIMIFFILFMFRYVGVGNLDLRC